MNSGNQHGGEKKGKKKKDIKADNKTLTSNTKIFKIKMTYICK
jgi:hypothetical protein